MMISPQYEAFFGSVERAGKHSIQTLFYHFMGFPLWPQETYVVSGDTLFGGELRVTEIKRSRASILAGYVRGWTTMSTIALLAIGIGVFFIPEAPFPQDPMPFGHSILSYLLTACGVGGIFVALGVWFATRKALSAEELAKRAVYAAFIGIPIDPAHLPSPWSMRDDMKRSIRDLSEQTGARAAYDDWPNVVMRPELASPQFLKMALTLTRLCVASPEEGRDPASLQPLHDALWARIQQLEPGIASSRP
jgi:hypothetical protein